MGIFHVAGSWWCSQTSLVLYEFTFFCLWLCVTRKENGGQCSLFFYVLYIWLNDIDRLLFHHFCYFFRVASPMNFSGDLQTWKGNYWFVSRNDCLSRSHNLILQSGTQKGQDACLKVALICMPSFINLPVLLPSVMCTIGFMFQALCRNYGKHAAVHVTIFGPLGVYWTEKCNKTRIKLWSVWM